VTRRGTSTSGSRILTSGIPQRLTSHAAADIQPSWSPDGKRLVFVSLRKDVKGDIYLWERGKQTPLTDRRTATAYPVFSPDGRSIYLAAGPEGLSRIERLDLGFAQAHGAVGVGRHTPGHLPRRQVARVHPV